MPRPSLRLVSLAGLALPLVAVACGSTPPPEVPQVEEARPAAAEAPCDSAEGCMAQAIRADKAGDEARAQPLFAQACELGAADGCNQAAVLLDPSQRAKRVALLEKGCELGSGAACANLGKVLEDPREVLLAVEKGCKLEARTCDDGARAAIDQEAWERARAMAERGCTDEVDVACGTLGSLVAKGLGGPQDVRRAGPLLKRGCDAGDQNACKNWAYYQEVTAQKGPASAAGGGEAAPAADAFAIPDASLTIGSLTADGFTVKDLACALEDSGFGALMAGPVLVASLASKKAALRACSPKGGEARVRLSMHGARVKAQAKAASPAVEACVVKALDSLPVVTAGTCAATLELGQ